MPDLASETPTRRPGRRYAVAGLWMLLLSSAFPIVASLVPAERIPRWIGGLDVLLAAPLFLCAVILDRSARPHSDEAVIRASYHAYRVLIQIPVALLAAFFLWADRINWSVLLVGLAWRFWLFGYILPSGMAAWSRRGPSPARGAGS